MVGAVFPPSALLAETRSIPDPGSLPELLDPRHPLAFLRAGDGIVGVGEAARLEFSGPDRVRDAATVWRSLATAATVIDPVDAPGTGLVAFGSFAFADDSAAVSVLVVPRVIIGRRDGVCWATTIDGAAIPGPTPIGAAVSARFEPGRLGEEAYVEAVQGALDLIADGGARKIVLARDLIGAIPVDSDLRGPIARLAAAYADTFTFAVDGLIGSSPETLVRADRGTVSARVLAGSAARGSDAMSDASAAATLAASRKDVAEHAFALASVMTALRLRTTTLTTSAHPFALRLPNLWHLASDVTGTLADGSSSLDLVAALHPTAAVAGEPRDVALRAISELESFDRGRYAGPVGWVDGNGDGEWAIALRCAQVDDGQVRAFAGAGIVAGSHPRRELTETSLKFRPIAEAFSR